MSERATAHARPRPQGGTVPAHGLDGSRSPRRGHRPGHGLDGSPEGDRATLPGGSRINEAVGMLDRLTHADVLEDFLTLPAYQRLD